jgi:ubiquinone/menaquinone biosynthesis C-methylase UbiE
MGLYGEHVLPRVINVMCGTKEFAPIRREECADLAGDIVEIGFGSGHNLPFLPDEVTGVWAVEPSGTGMKLAAKRIAATTIPVHPAALDGVKLELPDDRFDAALSTMTLCTIPDIDTALAELRRVLKPGASLHFAEHGHSPDPKVARTQDRFDGLEQKLAGGCHLNREIDTLIEKSGFEITSMRNFYMKGGPKAVSYMFVGTARNP